MTQAQTDLTESEAGTMAGWRVENSYGGLPPEFYTKLKAEVFGTPVLIHANAKAAALIDLDPAMFGNPDFAKLFAGHIPVAGFESLAAVYSGHQFGTYVARLGDGRALLIAQLRNAKGELWDVQLKGAGRTPYSRTADGRAVMRSCLREYLCSEAMAALSIPTTRALAVVATGEPVYRETVEPGAVLTRLAPSHVRFGHFEYFHHTGKTDAVRVLADHVIAEYFPHLRDREDRYEAWFAEVVKRTAQMVADWQAVGFCHGVMNTDNMSILGLTIDYGPFGFLDAHNPRFICNHSDPEGRYAYDQQPGIAHWNLRALAMALQSLLSVEKLWTGLDSFGPEFSRHFVKTMRAKLGFAEARAEDEKLMADLFHIMEKGEADHTRTFRLLSRVGDPAMRDSWLALFIEPVRKAASSWLMRYMARCESEPRDDRTAVMERINPKYVLRNWVAETAIRAVEDQGDTATLDRIMRLMQSPFDEHNEDESFAAPPQGAMCDLAVSCSS